MPLKPIWISHFTATSSIGRGLPQTLAALRERRGGLVPCAFDSVDFATFAAANPDLPWEHIARLARAQQCVDPLLGAILLMKRIFGCTIDPDLLGLAIRRPELVQTVDVIIARAQSLSQRQLAEELMGGFRLCETPKQTYKMFLSLLLTPTIGDFEAMPLAPNWWWIYRVTRPLRVLLSKFRGVAPKGTVKVNASAHRLQ